VYGFGSHFRGSKPRPPDIDILIVHTDLSAESIDAALKCKSLLLSRYNKLHISILSVREERELGFVRTCQAEPLCTVTESEVDDINDRIARSMNLSRRLLS
jgi:hypothetical protein